MSDAPVVPLAHYAALQRGYDAPLVA
jgi:hypothetical protein